MHASRSNSTSMIRSRLIEPLEGRRLLSSATLSSAGTLTVTGQATTPNAISVVESADGKTITVGFAATTATKALTASFATAKVKKVVVNGGSAADTISVGQAGKAFTVATRVNAGAGKDTVKTGAEADLIYGGDGDDLIYAGAGNDVVHAGSGNDVVHGGDGNDKLWGGPGKDSIYGEAGDDLLGGVLGVNAGYGGAGKDTFLVAKTLAGSFPKNDFTAADDKVQVGGTDD